ncbi:MAG: PadR family transcriptional regulator [Candidatus Aminicenantes bacterium]|nr:PadR family transcriptional regulator [Candidatus Aminicenantes bacterium]
MENKITQLRKGILELAILASLSRGRHYGYSLVKTISGDKEIVVQSEWVESSQGPPRKYYTLTLKGEEAFRVLEGEFRKLSAIVVNVQSGPVPGNTDEDHHVLSVKKETNNG